MEKKKQKKLWKYITLIFTIAGMGLLIFSIVGTGMDALIENSSNNTSLTLGELSSGQANNIVITSLDQEDLDQAQETTGSPNGICIGHNPVQGTGYWAMQLGYNDRNPLTGFQVMISEHGTTKQPIYIGIMKGKINPTPPENWYWYGVLNPGALPQKDTWYWVGADFSDNPIDLSGDPQWYIALVSQDPTTGDNHWAWGCNPDNPYPRCMIKTWYESSWNSQLIGVNFDGCFRTYTIEGPQDPPIITISISTEILTRMIGSISLIGAFLSGTKYFTMVI